jgi:hypothetical protein
MALVHMIKSKQLTGCVSKGSLTESIRALACHYRDPLSAAPKRIPHCGIFPPSENTNQFFLSADSSRRCITRSRYDHDSSSRGKDVVWYGSSHIIHANLI